MTRNRPNTRLTISNPEDWIDAVRDQADRDGQTVSEWLHDVAVANLDQDLAEQVGERPGLGRPPSLSG